MRNTMPTFPCGKFALRDRLVALKQYPRTCAEGIIVGMGVATVVTSEYNNSIVPHMRFLIESQTCTDTKEISLLNFR